MINLEGTKKKDSERSRSKSLIYMVGVRGLEHLKPPSRHRKINNLREVWHREEQGSGAHLSETLTRLGGSALGICATVGDVA